MQSNYGGYDPKIFIKTVNMDFMCSICSSRSFLTLAVVRKPKECTVCGSLVCESCIKVWTDKNSKIGIYRKDQQNYNFECPMRCKKSSDLKESIMKPIGKVIKNILYQLEVKCPNESCEQVMTLELYEQHEYICHLPKCQNPLCGIGSEKLIIVRLEN